MTIKKEFTPDMAALGKELKPTISSPKTIKSRKLVVLDVHIAPSSSSRTSLESDKEIVK